MIYALRKEILQLRNNKGYKDFTLAEFPPLYHDWLI